MSTALAKSRDKVVAVSAMTPALKSEFKEVAGWVAELAERNFLWYRRLGQKVVQIDEEAKKERYGLEPIPRLADALGIDEMLLWHSAALCREYTVEDLKKLAARHSPNGRTAIHWMHMTHLLTVEDKARRDKITEVVIEQALSVRELRELLVKQFGKRSSGGRPYSKPKSPSAGLQQIEQLSAKLVERHHAVWDDMLTNLDKLPPDQYIPSLLTQVEASLEQQRQVLKIVQENVARLEKSSERVRKIIEDNKDNKDGKKASE